MMLQNLVKLKAVKIETDEAKPKKFRVRFPGGFYSFNAESRRHCKDWKNIIGQAISMVVQKSHVVCTEKPIWVADISSKYCKICEEQFTVMFRKHHCRRCGQLVCADCSKSRMKLPSTAEKDAVRVCNLCVQTLKIFRKTLADTWVDDYESEQCLICDSEFTLFSRRHHCRRCGLLVCGKCSSGRALLPRINKTDMVRVCKRCEDTLNAVVSDHDFLLDTEAPILPAWILKGAVSSAAGNV
eukprot:298216_1